MVLSELDRRITPLTDAASHTLDDIRGWFRNGVGRHVLNTERALLDQLLPGYFGYHLLQLSVQDEPLCEASPIRNRVRVGLEHSPGSGMVSHPAHLPFADDSVDTVLLHHLLEFSENPQDILKEVSRVTIPMGHLVIIGFNPFSMFGMWKSVAQLNGRAPWQSELIRSGRLMDWLTLLDFKIDRAQYAIYRPPISRFVGKVGDYSQGVSRHLNLPVGSVYVIVARKHIGSVRPIRPAWKQQKAFGGLSVVRSVKHDGLVSRPHPDKPRDAT